MSGAQGSRVVGGWGCLDKGSMRHPAHMLQAYEQHSWQLFMDTSSSCCYVADGRAGLGWHLLKGSGCSEEVLLTVSGHVQMHASTQGADESGSQLQAAADGGGSILHVCCCLQVYRSLPELHTYHVKCCVV